MSVDNHGALMGDHLDDDDDTDEEEYDDDDEEEEQMTGTTEDSRDKDEERIGVVF